MRFTNEDRASIATAYRQAKDKPAQLQILSELYACKVADIKTVLTDAGYPPEELDRRKRPRNIGKATAPATPGAGRLPGVLKALREELAHLEKRALDLPDQIEALKREYMVIDGKKKAIEESIALLTGLIES
jgi:hypothetical protein